MADSTQRFSPNRASTGASTAAGRRNSGSGLGLQEKLLVAVMLGDVVKEADHRIRVYGDRNSASSRFLAATICSPPMKQQQG